MIRNYIKLAIRNLSRQKGFSAINILGLSIGLACVIVIMLYVQQEQSYDRFHEKAARIYRVTGSTQDLSVAITPAAIVPAVAGGFSEIASGVRTSMYSPGLFQTGDVRFEETRVLYADSNFFEVFDYEFVRGNPKSALADAQNVILSEESARRYFGSADPIGKSLRVNDVVDVQVTAVVRVPVNTHLQPQVVLPMSLLARTDRDLTQNPWDNFNYYSYVVAERNLSPTETAEVNRQITAMYQKHEADFKVEFMLQPVTDIHLRSSFMGDVPGQGKQEYVVAFVVVALFILVVACINFMNLSTARSARRAKEVGLRKVSGALRSQLIGQFLCESLIITLISLAIALALSLLSLNFINVIAAKQLSLDLLGWKPLLSLAIITIVTGLLAGSYPAMVLSGFVPAKVLKRETAAGNGGVVFRNVLVVTQFVVSVVLLSGTAVVYQQMQFVRRKSVGYTKDNLLYIEFRGVLSDKTSQMKSRLEQNRLTEKYTVASNVPTNMVSGTASIEWEGKDRSNQTMFAHMSVDENFIDVLKMDMAAGRTFSNDIAADTSNYIVNETALNIMGFTTQQAVGQWFSLWGRKGMIVGVVRDFNFKPLQKAVEPLVMRYNGYQNVVMVRVEPANISATVSVLENICRELNPAYPFTYKYVDEDLANLYMNEQQVGRLFNIFAALAIFISCLGLYGLSAFVAEQRTKEIGIRKALGATVLNIVRLLSARFLIPIVVAIIIAAPIAYYVMDSWLSGFAYRVDFGWIVFGIAGTLALTTGFVTISFECVKAARANPVNSLRNE